LRTRGALLDGVSKGYSQVERYKLEKLLKELGEKRGRGTELISLYVPAGRQIGEIASMLREEYSTASNIKDRTTRHHVLDALTVVMQRLRLFRKTPPNGLVIFAGYIDTGVPGKEEMEVHVLEPPEKLTTYLYRCDSRFHTEILEEMVAVKDVYALIVVDRSEAAIALLKGRTLEIVDRLTSGIPGKHRAGGQSARRFERIIEQLAHEFYKRLGEHANNRLLSVESLKGIIIGGPGPTKYEFAEGDYLHYMLKQKILAILDTGYSGEEGIYELVKRSGEILRDVEYMQERRVVQEFLNHVARDTGLATYGVKEVEAALQRAAVDKLLVSTELKGVKKTYKCQGCGYSWTELHLDTASQQELQCPKCRADAITVVEEEDLADYLIKLAESTGAKIEIVSTNSEEGAQLYRAFGGVAAILRFKL